MRMLTLPRETSATLWNPAVTVVLGTQWGDEGKGKLVDILAQEIDVCARCAGGNNAGHTIVVPMGPNNEKTMLDFHLLPCGLVNPKCVGLIGSGVVVHIPSFFSELEKLEAKGLNCEGRLLISDRAHLVFDFHQIVDGLKEVELGGKSIGTTKKGIGPAYSAKASRSGLRVHHLFDPTSFSEKFRKIVEGRFKRYGHFEYDTEAEIERYKGLAERLKPYVIDSVSYMHKALRENKRVLVEGANALMLDLDYGTYPFVTSSSTAIGGVCTGLAIPPKQIGRIIGVVKAYTTRVGGGPFPTEQLNEVGNTLQEVGHEYGTTTGRRRRCGWLDLVVLKYSNNINGYDLLNLTKLDVLDGLDEIKVAVKYKLGDQELEGFPADLDLLARVEVEYVTMPGWKADISKATTYDELPEKCREYVEFIETFLGVKIGWIGVGPARHKHSNGAVEPASLSALAAASQLGSGENKVTGIVIGSKEEVDKILPSVKKLQGLDAILHSSSALYSPPLPETLTPLFKSILSSDASKYTHLFSAHSSAAKSILPRVAATLDLPAVSDITSISYSSSDDTTIFTRPIYAGNAIATVRGGKDIQLKVVTVRPTSFTPLSDSPEGSKEVSATEVAPVEDESTSSLTKHLETSVSTSDRPDLGVAKKVVSGGRALKNKETFEKTLNPLAEILGAAVGASRAAVDAGYADNSLQVGQTGKIVAPELYIAIGISGAIQHLAGMKDSKMIVAINKDADAPIFQVADVGLVGDLYDIVPEVIEKLK